MGAVWLFGALASGPRIEGVEQVWVQAAGSLLFLITLPRWCPLPRLPSEVCRFLDRDGGRNAEGELVHPT